MSSANVETITANGVDFRYKPLGGHRIAVFLSHLDSELREKLCKASGRNSYTKGNPYVNKDGELICRINPNGQLTFKEGVEKVLNLLAPKIRKHERLQSSSRGGKKRRRHKGSRRRR